jgi:hypothetical protein
VSLHTGEPGGRTAEPVTRERRSLLAYVEVRPLCPSRQAAGAVPVALLNARLKAASES